MQFSEDDLRAALKRKDPGPSFTQRVMARVAERKESSSSVKPARDWFVWLQPLRLHPAVSAAVAALVLIVAGSIGYEQFRRNEIVKERQEIERQQEATRQTILALQIANKKLNHVFARVKRSETNDPKVRRQL
ncbi:MAG TPA: hypothetical protein VKL40_14205 [Candidatus Angelobacter sp.]|nr:hypothetical protein [Candidatus Angelobacter sp.]